MILGRHDPLNRCRNRCADVGRAHHSESPNRLVTLRDDGSASESEFDVSLGTSPRLPRRRPILLLPALPPGKVGKDPVRDHLCIGRPALGFGPSGIACALRGPGPMCRRRPGCITPASRILSGRVRARFTGTAYTGQSMPVTGNPKPVVIEVM